MDFKEREHLFLLRILSFHNMNIDLLTGRMQREKTSQKEPRGRPGSQEVWPAGHTLPPKILRFFPKFLYKLLNSLLPLILEI
jgi:hypothetical protein